MKKSHKNPELSPVRPQQAIGWSLAAATGLLLAGCPDKKSPEEGSSQAAEQPAANTPSDKECCMGKNDCKGKGGCAVPESNDCAGKNDCKGKGGCNMHCPK